MRKDSWVKLIKEAHKRQDYVRLRQTVTKYLQCTAGKTYYHGSAKELIGKVSKADLQMWYRYADWKHFATM